MSTKHTPGPWTLNTNGRTPIVSKLLPDGGEPLPIVDVVQGYNKAQCMANARLIAAAPDLLVALQYMLDVYGNDGHFHAPALAAMRAAKAAIAKATGVKS